MTDTIHHWHIAGLGAIGSLCNATALMSATKVTPIVREGSHNYCTHFVDLSGNTLELTSPVTLTDVDTIERLVVPLKSYDVLPYLSQVKSKLTNTAQVVLCHNGMGTIEPALEILPSTVNLYFCTSSHGVYKQDRQAKYAGLGESSWQLIHKGNADELSNEEVNAILPRARRSTNLNLLLWQKLIINCAINPLTAIHKVKNGKLAAEQFQPLITAVVEEAVDVAKANDVEINVNNMLDKVNQVIHLTGANTSSMLQDVLNNRPTEIDFITGYLINQAQKLGFNLPKNQELYKAIKSL